MASRSITRESNAKVIGYKAMKALLEVGDKEFREALYETRVKGERVNYGEPLYSPKDLAKLEKHLNILQYRRCTCEIVGKENMHEVYHIYESKMNKD